ncbi:MAG: thioesterase [bacterium]|nr:thioesterase [bacterium]
MSENCNQSYLTGKLAWENNYPLRYYEMDSQMILKPSSLLNFLQDMATLNAEMLGFGYSFTSERNLGWFLIKYHMEFDEYPANLDEITIITEARGASKLFALRDFELWTVDKKKRLGRITSNWFILDLETKTIKPPLSFFSNMSAVEKRESDMNFAKFKLPEVFDFEHEFEIRYDDIDVNQHVNNSNYIVWAFEALPADFRKNNILKELDIVYKKEVKFGNNVLSKVKIENDTTYHSVVNQETDEELCLLKAIWKAL